MMWYNRLKSKFSMFFPSPPSVESSDETLTVTPSVPQYVIDVDKVLKYLEATNKPETVVEVKPWRGRSNINDQ